MQIEKLFVHKWFWKQNLTQKSKHSFYICCSSYNPRGHLNMELNTIAKAIKKTEKVTPKELIWRHIKDPNHIITEEEFSKLVVGFDIEDNAVHQQN